MNCANTHWQIVATIVYERAVFLSVFLSLLSHLFFGFMTIQEAKTISMMPVCDAPYAGKEFHYVLEVVLITSGLFKLYRRTSIDDFIEPVIFQISFGMSS